MTPEIFFSVLIIGVLVFGLFVSKPVKTALIRKVAKSFVDIFCAYSSKMHVYQRGEFEITEKASGLFYIARQTALETYGCRHIGDTENMNMRPVLPGGGMFQKHFVNAAEDTSIALTHIRAKKGKRRDLIHIMSACTYFDTGTTISSVSSDNEQIHPEDSLPSSMIVNHRSFEMSCEEFLEKHQHEVDLYLDNREGSHCERCHDMESVLRLANDKQKKLHEHVWAQGDPMSEEHLRARLDPRMHHLIPEIKREADRLLMDREEVGL